MNGVLALPRIKFTGLDEYIAKIERLGYYPKEYVGKAIYKGAEVVANKTKEALEKLPVDNRQNNVEHRTSINAKQRKGLIESFGIAPLRDDRNFLNVKTGFDGYNDIVTARWPLGQPNAVIARSLESGTSFMDKNPVISRATKNSKNQAITAMRDSLNNSIEEIMK